MVYIFLSILKVLLMQKVNFKKKNPALPIEKFPSLVHVAPRNAIMLQHRIDQFSLHCLSSGRLWEVKNKRKFQNFNSKSDCSHLQEDVAYKRFQI